MYLDSLSFLEDERDAWRPFEALNDLTDDQLDREVAAATVATARALMAHLAARQEQAVAAAKELAVGVSSWTIAAGEPGPEVDEAWAGLPGDEIRDRFRTAPGELRGYLTVVPETRWLKHPAHLAWFLAATIDHYDDHAADLAAIREAAG